MNLGGKQDLDALLRSWPAKPPKGVVAGTDEERGWDDRADAIVRAAGAAARDSAAKDAAEALFAAPTLAPEAGEDTVAVGEKKMSQEKEPSGAPASTATPVPSQKRQSLKEIAARASQSSARLSQPGPVPASTPAPSRASMPPISVPAPAPLPRPSEAGKEDSGVINLKAVNAAATPQQHADAAKAKPAQAGLLDDEKPAAASAAEKPAAVTASNVATLQPKKSNAGAIGGIAIAVIGIAAAFAIIARKPPAPPATVAAQDDKAAVTATPTPSVAPAPATAAPTAVASAEPAATAEPDTKTAEAPKGPTVVAPSGPATAGATATADAKLAAKTPTPTGKPGDLQSEMAKAVGKDGAAKQDQAVAPTPEPAAAHNQNIPEQPSQGAVAAAFGPVMGGAKACVAGADDVSRASVTFSSSGAVTSVSVSGWAAANGKSACVQAALKAAKVGPFSKPSFTVGVPIRP